MLIYLFKIANKICLFPIALYSKSISASCNVLHMLQSTVPLVFPSQWCYNFFQHFNFSVTKDLRPLD